MLPDLTLAAFTRGPNGEYLSPKVLNAAIICNWMEATYKKTGKYITAAPTSNIWASDEEGSIHQLDVMNGNYLNVTISQGQKELKDERGEPLWSGLKEFREIYGYTNKHTNSNLACVMRGDGNYHAPQILNAAIIRNWMEATYKQTGKYLLSCSRAIWASDEHGNIHQLHKINGHYLNTAISQGHKGLKDGNGHRLWSSLKEFRVAFGYTNTIKTQKTGDHENHKTQETNQNTTPIIAPNQWFEDWVQTTRGYLTTTSLAITEKAYKKWLAEGANIIKVVSRRLDQDALNSVVPSIEQTEAETIPTVLSCPKGGVEKASVPSQEQRRPMEATRFVGRVQLNSEDLSRPRPQEPDVPQKKKLTDVDFISRLRIIFSDHHKITGTHINKNTQKIFVFGKEFAPTQQPTLTGEKIDQWIRARYSKNILNGNGLFPSSIENFKALYGFIPPKAQECKLGTFLPLLSEDSLCLLIEDTREITRAFPTVESTTVWMKNNRNVFQKHKTATWAMIDEAIKTGWSDLHDKERKPLAAGLDDFLIKHNYTEDAPFRPRKDRPFLVQSSDLTI